jgi:hypothetical protein
VKLTEESPDVVKAFRTKLYVLLLESLADAACWRYSVYLLYWYTSTHTDAAACWSAGLEATAKALKLLPASCHKALWDFRITFLGKLGKDTSAEMVRCLRTFVPVKQ